MTNQGDFLYGGEMLSRLNYQLAKLSPEEIQELASEGRRRYDSRRREARRAAQQRYWAKRALQDRAALDADKPEAAKPG